MVILACVICMMIYLLYNTKIVNLQDDLFSI